MSTQIDPRQKVGSAPQIRDERPERTVDTRQSELRPEAYSYRPPNQLPDVKQSPDTTYRWCRFMLRAGVDDPGNMSKHRRDGYVPIPWEEREAVLIDKDSIDKHASGNIVINDVMLCRRPRYKTEARQKYYEQVTNKQVAATKNAAKNLERKDADRYGGINDNSTNSFETGRKREVSFGE